MMLETALLLLKLLIEQDIIKRIKSNQLIKTLCLTKPYMIMINQTGYSSTSHAMIFGTQTILRSGRKLGVFSRFANGKFKYKLNRGYTDIQSITVDITTAKESLQNDIVYSFSLVAPKYLYNRQIVIAAINRTAFCSHYSLDNNTLYAENTKNINFT